MKILRRKKSMKRVGVTASKEQYAKTYCDALRLFGIEPVVLTPESAPNALDTVHGLVLTGGSDINPEIYGAERAEETQDPNDERDAFEMDILKKAIDRDMPVLAICRGIQMLNVVNDGTLIQHLPTADDHNPKIRSDDEKAESVHMVSLDVGSKLGKILGPRAFVNSRHHQAVFSVGKDLHISALSEDGVVEAVEMPDKKFVVGVQWHPENQVGTNKAADKLFQAFADQL